MDVSVVSRLIVIVRRVQRYNHVFEQILDKIDKVLYIVV